MCISQMMNFPLNTHPLRNVSLNCSGFFVSLLQDFAFNPPPFEIGNAHLMSDKELMFITQTSSRMHRPKSKQIHSVSFARSCAAVHESGSDD